jgi:hypothetical protein
LVSGKCNFSMRRGDDDWSTHTPTYTHIHLVVYPNVMSTSDTMVFDGEEKDFVMKVAECARDNGFQCIDCSCGASIPSTQGHQRDVCHCHPSFHLYSYLKQP